MGSVNRIVHGFAELWIDSVDVGYTSEGVTESVDREYFDQEVEQIKGAIKSEMISETKTISCTLAEVSLNRLNQIWDQEGSKLVGGTFLAIGTEGGANEHTLTIVAPAPADTGFTYMNVHIFKAISMEAGEVIYSRSEPTRIPVSFKCLKDVSNGNQFGYISLSNTKGA